MKYKIALLIGRFQPFHKGHLYLLKKALRQSETVIIGIGSSNITDVNNPMDYLTREKIIKAVLYKERLENKVTKIIPLDDFYNDKKWLENVKKMVGQFDLVVGNNDWVNGIMKKAGFKILECPYYKRELYEGWRIRELIKKKGAWENRVPKYLVNFLNNQINEKIFNNLAIKQYKHVVLGGTFDHLHLGHEALISKAVGISDKVTIGLTTEPMHKNKLLFKSIESYDQRKKEILGRFGSKNVKIIPLNDIYGNTLSEKEIDAIVVSRETFQNAIKINEMRKASQIKPLQIIIIEDILDENGKKICSDRIRLGEVSPNGICFDLPSKGALELPEKMREELRKPLGQVHKSIKSIKFVKSIKSAKLRGGGESDLIIAVGDVIVDSLIKEGIDPDVKVIDLRSRRQKFSIFNFQFSNNLKKYKNKPGTINIKAAVKLKELIKTRAASYLSRPSSSGGWFIIDGEEDLLALPVILYAPLGSLVLYGHFQYGIIKVKVDIKIKTKVLKLLGQFTYL